jgi:hypothetical protein
MTVITWRRAVVGASLAAAGLLMVGCSKNDEVTPSTAAEATASMDSATPAPTPGASGSVNSGGVPASAPPTGVAPTPGTTGSDTGYVGGDTSSPVGPAAGSGSMGSTAVAPPSGGTAGRPRSSGE